MKILYKNETPISKSKIRKLEKYAKRYYQLKMDIIKMIICLVNISFSVYILFNEGNKVGIFIILLSMFGILDIIWGIDIKKEKLIYEFYDTYFRLDIFDETLEVYYSEIQKFIEEKNTFYIVLNNLAFYIDKDKFANGNEKEIIEFMKQKLEKI